MIRTSALLSLAGAIGLLVWWFLMPLLLPVAEASTQFQNMILDRDWIPVNIAGLISTILITLGFPGFSLCHRENPDRIGSAGLIITSTGLILFACVQYYETLIWPAAAAIHPDLLQVKGALVSGNQGVTAGLLFSGIALGCGYILFGISALRTRRLPKIPVWFLISGAPVFANGIVFPVRTIGLLLFCAGTIWLALHLRKSETD